MPPRVTSKRQGRPAGQRSHRPPNASPPAAQAPGEAVSRAPGPSPALLAVWRAGASLGDLSQLLARPLEALEADLRAMLTAHAPSPRGPRPAVANATPAPRGPRVTAPPATSAPQRPKPTRRRGRPARPSAPPSRPRPASREAVLERVRSALAAAPPEGRRLSTLSLQCAVPIARLRRLTDAEIAAGRLVREGAFLRLPAPPAATKADVRQAARARRTVQTPEGDEFEIVWPPAEESV